MATDENLEIPAFLRRPAEERPMALINKLVASMPGGSFMGQNMGAKGLQLRALREKRFAEGAGNRKEKAASTARVKLLKKLVDARSKPAAVPPSEESVMKAKKTTTKKTAKPAAKAKASSKPKAKAAAKAKPSLAGESGPGPRAGSKTAIVAQLLQRQEGCTNAEVLEATKWPTVSMNQQAKAAGLVLKKEKLKGQPTRYFGTPKVAA